METVNVRSHAKIRVLLVASVDHPRLCSLGAVVGFAYSSNNAAGNVLTHNLSEPLDGATTAKVDINTGDGNLTIDRLTGGEQVLASGTLQYLENQGLPTRSVNTSNGQATLTLKASGGGQPWFRFPWAACNGATEWQIHLNPTCHPTSPPTAMAAMSS